MYRPAIVVAILGLAACSSGSPYQTGGYQGTSSGSSTTAKNINCGAGVIGGAAVGGILGNQIGKGKGQDVATAAGATIGAVLGSGRDECQTQAQTQPAYGGYAQTTTPVLVGYDQYGRPVYR